MHFWTIFGLFLDHIWAPNCRFKNPKYYLRSFVTISKCNHPQKTKKIPLKRPLAQKLDFWPFWTIFGPFSDPIWTPNCRFKNPKYCLRSFFTLNECNHTQKTIKTAKLVILYPSSINVNHSAVPGSAQQCKIANFCPDKHG